MESQGAREGTNGREARRAVVCFVLLVSALVFAFSLYPSAESLVQSFGYLGAALCAFTVARRGGAKGIEEDVRRPHSKASNLFWVTVLILVSVLLFYLFDAFLADFVNEMVPASVSGFVQRVVQGGGVGIFIYFLSEYSGSYWLNREERKESLRSLKIAAAVSVSLALVVVFIYVAIEYVLGPVIRFFA